MADFAAVLRKTIDGLKENTPEMRKRVYDKARATIEAKLAAVSPPPPAALADRQRRHLEDAIATVEADYAPPPPEPLPPAAEDDDGLDRLLADLDPRTIRPAPAPVPPYVDPQAGHTSPDDYRVDHAPRYTPSEEPFGETGAIGEEMPPWMSEREREQDAPRARPRRRRRRLGPLVAAMVVLLLVAGAAAAWMNRDSLGALPGVDRIMASLGGSDESSPAATGSEPETEQSAPAEDKAAEKPSATETAKTDGGSNKAASPTQPEKSEKFTQRLTESGDEVDEGPAGEEPKIGEGTSVASASGTAAAGEATAADTTPSGEPAAATSDSAQLAVGQKAIFYEERTNAAQGSAEPGNIVWSLVQESPGDDLPPEPAIRGEATIPGKNLQLRITIKRNADKSLPASHIVEMIFLTPDDFEGGGIDNVLRIAMKQSEQDTGNPLLGIPAKIADGFFLFALNNSKAEEQTNLLLLRRQQWIDIPLLYKSGRRALITMEKGVPGEKVFDEALEAWSKESSG